VAPDQQHDQQHQRGVQPARPFASMHMHMTAAARTAKHTRLPRFAVYTFTPVHIVATPKVKSVQAPPLPSRI
jgi:hypothetical protein